ncbi:hypothetical protein [Brachybacterium sp. FME24]|uniref:hypothetical protein n=1 Tax=Brachybacterium sp. FME24 TaxID=2742605 RepID=UPI001D00ADC5|nr:hypothetical protein [Brachybacterium sp. FME24]
MSTRHPASSMIPSESVEGLSRRGIDRRAVLRGAGLLGALTAAGGTLAAPAQAASPDTLDPKDFTLTADYDAYTARVEALLEQAGSASVSEVMDNANHDRTEARVLDDQVHGFRFASSDENDPDAFPQGITTSRDAVGTADNGRYDGRQVIAVSFYNNSPKSSRINLIDWDAKHPNSYRRILLVEPTGTEAEPSFQDIGIHVGGISWYGDLLYVADTGAGMRVFDMSRIVTTDTGGSKDQIGRVGDSFYAHNYAYVLPQVGTISSTVADGTEKLVWSTISLDRVSRSIVMTEYRCVGCDTYPEGSTRAVRFPFADGGSRFAATTTATEALEVPVHYLNGVASHNGRWWFNDSHHKTLHHWSGSGAMTSYPWVSWGQSLSYWEDADGPDLLWCLKEKEGDRPVFAVKQGDYS